MSTIKSFLHKLRNNYWTFDVLEKYHSRMQEIKFVQIGSNDGQHGDPIFRYIQTKKWKGILVEPIPYLFERLKKNYNYYQENLLFENSAIASTAGESLFYRLRESNYNDLPEWYDQLGSFNKEVVIKHRNDVPHFDELFIEDIVHAITFQNLLTKYSISRLNLLHIDTEGYDYEILKMVPFDELKIDIIMFEHKHLSVDNYASAIKLLKKNEMISRKISNSDTLAIHKKVFRKLRFGF